MKKQKVNQKQTKCSRPGFSLLEVLIVIAILALLMAVFGAIGVTYLNFKKRSQTDLLLNVALNAASKMNEDYGRAIDHRECQFYRVVGSGIDRTMTPTEFFLYKCSFSQDAYGKLKGLTTSVVNATATAGSPAADGSDATILRVKVLYSHQDKANPTNPWLVDVVTDYAAGDPTKPGYALVTLVDGWGREIEYRMSRQDLGWDTDADGVNDKPNDPFLPSAWTIPPFWVGWVGAGFDVRYGTAVDSQVGVANPVNPAMPNYGFPFFASAGADGKWGVLTGHQIDASDADAKDNVYSIQPKAN